MTDVNVICYLSIIFLAFFCFLDFKNNIPKPKPVWPFYCALILFLLANSIIYISLLPILSGIELKVGGIVFGEKSGANVFEYQNVSPIIIAMLYFGFGKATIEVGGKEYAFYGLMLNMFRSMFPRSLGVTRKLNEYIDRLGDETENLKRKVTTLQEVAEDHKWKMYMDEWSEIESTARILEKEMDFLKGIKSTISVDKASEIDIDKTLRKLDEQIEKSTLNINNRLRNYLKKLINKNIFHEKSIDEIAYLIDVKSTTEIIEKRSSNHIARAFGVSFLCGILLGIALTFHSSSLKFGTNELIFYLIGSFFIFLSVFAFIDKLEWSINGFSISLIVGAIGGLCGHTAFNIISKHSRLLPLFIPDHNFDMSFYQMLKILSEESTLGIIIGMFSALIAYLFKHFINTSIENTIVKYVLVSLAGGFMVLCISKLIPTYSFGDDFYTGTICPVVTGLIVLTGISFVSGIFEKKV